jgi:hypothetical protein
VSARPGPARSALGPCLGVSYFFPSGRSGRRKRTRARQKKKWLVLYSTSWVPTDVPNTVLTDWPAWCEAGSHGAYYYTYSVGHTKHSYSKLVEASSTAFSKAVAVERRHPPQLRRPSAHEPDHRHLPPPSWCYPCSARRTEAPSAAACWWRGSLVSFVTDDSAKQTSWSAAARSPRLPACHFKAREVFVDAVTARRRWKKTLGASWGGYVRCDSCEVRCGCLCPTAGQRRIAAWIVLLHALRLRHDGRDATTASSVARSAWFCLGQLALLLFLFSFLNCYHSWFFKVIFNHSIIHF